MGSLTGKSVVIMGASSGMGRACARAFSAEGAKVVAAARRKTELDSLVADIARSGGTAVAVPADVSKRAEVDAAVQRAEATLVSVKLKAARKTQLLQTNAASQQDVDDGQSTTHLGTPRQVG